MNDQTRKPKILFLVDFPGWAYDNEAHLYSRCIASRYDTEIVYKSHKPDLSQYDFDLLFIHYWAEIYHAQFKIDTNCVIKQFASHKWLYQDRYPSDTQQMIFRYVHNAAHLTAISKRLQSIISPYRDIYFAPQTIDTELFSPPSQPRSGPIRFGWAGSLEKAEHKGIHDIILPAAEGLTEVKIAGGDLTHEQMRDFYHSIDVLLVGSLMEGGPLPPQEAMACGCYVVSTDVGIIPEIVEHQKNGLIVERRVDAFRDAIRYCKDHSEEIRQAASTNATFIQENRSIDALKQHWLHVFDSIMQDKAEARAALKPANENNDPHETKDLIKYAKTHYSDHFTTANPTTYTHERFMGSSSNYEVELKPLLPENKQARILEVGVGLGHLVRYLHEAGYHDITGLELDPGLTQGARRYLGKKFNILQADVMKYLAEQPDNSFDFIVMFDVIEHLSKNEGFEFARQTYRVLRPGGRVAVRTINMANAFASYTFYDDLTHQQAYTPGSLTTLFRLAGYPEAMCWPYNREPPRKLDRIARRIYYKLHRAAYRLDNRIRPKWVGKNMVVYATKSTETDT